MEFRFKTSVIFTVDAESERDALNALFAAIGEPMVQLADAVAAAGNPDAEIRPITFNTMRAIETITPANAPHRVCSCGHLERLHSGLTGCHPASFCGCKRFWLDHEIEEESLGSRGESIYPEHNLPIDAIADGYNEE